MIDLHCHILPGIDDGSRNMEESLAMAKMAVESGVRAIAATPHCSIPDRYDNYNGPELLERMELFKEYLQKEEIPLQVYPGMEVYATEELPELLKAGKLMTIAGSRYLLVEFGFHEDPEWVEILLETILNQNYVPLVAHPERYAFIRRNPGLAYRYVRMGCALQMNKASILGRFGQSVQELSMELLACRLITCVASDAHSNTVRTPHMKEVREYLDDTFGKGCGQLLLMDNPERILKNEEIVRLEPKRPEKW